jgi:two-component system chemotaxis response regulator CheY
MGKKILIADDSLFMRKMLKDILTVEDKYVIVEAQNGKEAEQQFKKYNPDLTLLDIIMPEGDEEGITVLKMIKQLSSGAKVVMITAVGQDSIIAACKKAGANDYIIKPFDKDKVLGTVAKYLN